MTVTGFIVQHGRILVEESFSPGALDPALLDAARTVFEALQAGQDTVPLPQCLGENGVVGLGNPVLPLEYVPEAERENWLATQNAVAQEQRRTGFHIAISGRIEFELKNFDKALDDFIDSFLLLLFLLLLRVLIGILLLILCQVPLQSFLLSRPRTLPILQQPGL